MIRGFLKEAAMNRFERIILKGYWLELLEHLVRIITLGWRRPDYQVRWLGKAMCALATTWRDNRTWRRSWGLAKARRQFFGKVG